MLRTMFVALSMLAASTGALAGHDDRVYGRVVSVEPSFVISLGGGRHHDGFRIRYEFGGHHYWTHSHHHPGHYIWVPRPYGYIVHHPHHHYDDWRGRWDDRRRYDHNHGHNHGRRHDDRWDDRR